MKQSINRLSPTVAVCTVLLLLAGARITAVASQIVPGHVPRATAGLQPVRQLDGTNQLKLAISLPLRDKVGLTNLLQEIYDPTSPNYHHYLSAAQFAERFGPTEADYQALKAFVISNNFGVIGSHPNRTLLDVSASVADIDRTFHLKLQK